LVRVHVEWENTFLCRSFSEWSEWVDGEKLTQKKKMKSTGDAEFLFFSPLLVAFFV
jgi:hypothetical protein